MLLSDYSIELIVKKNNEIFQSHLKHFQGTYVMTCSVLYVIGFQEVVYHETFNNDCDVIKKDKKIS